MKTQLLIIISILTLRLHAGIGSGTSSVGALPVELTNFTAVENSEKVELNWTTVTEVKNYGFYVERNAILYNGKDEPINESGNSWVNIGFVAGHGNSNSTKEYSFVDEPVLNGLYQYRLKQIDTDGHFEYSAIIKIHFGTAPKNYSLSQNYPNPFNPSTVISYSIPTASNVSLKVFDVLGNLITTLVNQNQEAGNYSINFNASKFSSGIYFYKIQVNPANGVTGGFMTVKKMLLIK